MEWREREGGSERGRESENRGERGRLLVDWRATGIMRGEADRVSELEKERAVIGGEQNRGTEEEGDDLDCVVEIV